MKRIHMCGTALAALTALVALTGCSSDTNSDSEPTRAPSSTSADTSTSPKTDSAAPTEDVDPSAAGPTSFESAYTDVTDLFAVLGTQEEVNPTSADEANLAAGLDETTDLFFVDYSVLPEDSGSFCLFSTPNSAYVAVTYTGLSGEVLLGLGDCSYEAEDASVVGDPESDEWSVGADLMGDQSPRAVFGG